MNSLKWIKCLKKTTPFMSSISSSSLKKKMSSSIKKRFATTSSVKTMEDLHYPSRLEQLKLLNKDANSPNLDHFIHSSMFQKKQRELTEYEMDEYYSSIRLPVLEATTINPEAYRSEDYFKVEQNNVFGNSWQAIAHTSQFKRHGDTVVATVGGQPVFITKGKDNQLRGFYNVCRHRGAQLVSENGRYPVISCPYHRWGYALDGRLLATPMFKGDGISEQAGADFTNEPSPSEEIKKAFSTEQVKNFNKKDYGLFPIRIETWGPLVFANASGTAPPLKTYFGDLDDALEQYPFSELLCFKTRKIQVKANWKLLAENFMEYYHLPSVHPELCNVSSVDAHHRAQGTGSYVGLATYPLNNGGTPIDVNLLPAMEGLSGSNKETAWFHHLFPNVFYFLLPHSFYSVILEPVGPDTTIEHSTLLVHPNALEHENANQILESMFDFYDFVNNQDLSICEKVQIGVKAQQYQGGRITFRFEEPIHRFQNMVADYMTHKPSIPVGDEEIPYKFQREQ